MGGSSLILKTSVLLPVLLLALGLVLGGGWPLVALFYLSIFAFLIDEAVGVNPEQPFANGTIVRVLENALPILLALAHFALLPLVILTLAAGDGTTLEKALIFAGFSLFFGSMSTANAHELIHRKGLLRPALGKWVFTSLLFGHHTSAHLAVHHRHAATPHDPNSARMNEGFYRFFLRAWFGSFRAGLSVENQRLVQMGRSPFHPANPYLIYIGGALVFLSLAYVLAGTSGVLIYLAFAGLAQVQLLLSDYVQHYGLDRLKNPEGEYEPVSTHHSWNAPYLFSSTLMMNAPHHSAHHAHPGRDYRALSSEAGAPLLPRSLPAMSCLALLPGLWKRVMNPYVIVWRLARQADVKFDPTEAQKPV
jgi:alkane 1-monooxygenase